MDENDNRSFKDFAIPSKNKLYSSIVNPTI